MIGSYLKIDQTTTNDYFDRDLDGITADTASDREDPQDIFSINYTGILTPSFFVEAQYSERNYHDRQGRRRRPRSTSPRARRSRPARSSGRSSTTTRRLFCGICEHEERNNEDVLGKVSWFESTESLGTHDIVFGYDSFTDIRFAVNHQAATDFNVWDSGTVFGGEDVFPVIVPCAPGPGCETTTGQATDVGPPAWFLWWAVFGLEQRPADAVRDHLLLRQRPLAARRALVVQPRRALRRDGRHQPERRRPCSTTAR